MKLSCSKKFGWIHVHGGRLMRVTKEHAVPTSTRSQLADEKKPEAQKGQKAVWAKEGDLALEIVARKTGKCLGYSYLSGPALQLNRYIQIGEYVEPAGDVGLLEIPHPHGDSPENFLDEVILLFMPAKYAMDRGVYAFEYCCLGENDPRHVAEILVRCMAYESENLEPTSHIIGVVHGPKGKKKGSVTIHYQPPFDSDECHVTSFQVELAVTAARHAAAKKEKD